MRAGILGLLLPAIVLAAPAQAGVVFCNKFPQTVWVAIAYPQGNDRWLSRGWESLDPEACAPFDTALRVGTFFFRAESVPYRDDNGRRIRMFWGKGREFAIWERDNFNYWDAQERVLNSSMAEFTQGPEASNGNVSATITFTPDGSSISFK